MRIGVYHPRVGTSTVGGTENFIRNIMAHFQEQHEIVLYTGSGEIINEINTMGVEIIEIPFISKDSSISKYMSQFTPILSAEIASISMFWNGKRLGELSGLDEKIDVMTTYYYLDNLLVSQTIDVPHLFRYPGIKNNSIRWKLMAKFANPDMYIAGSKDAKTRGEKWLDLQVGGVVTAGVDVDRFSPDAESAFESDHLSLLYVGRLDSGKGLDVLLEAISHTTKLMDNIHLYIVGTGTLEKSLRQQTKKLDINNIVTFIGSIPHSDIHRYYAAADIFVLPSEYEGFPNVTMEAMASALPVVSTEVPGVTEQVSHMENGFLIEPNDIEALVEAICTLAENKRLRQSLGSTARAHAQNNFAWEAQADNFEKLIESIID